MFIAIFESGINHIKVCCMIATLVCLLKIEKTHFFYKYLFNKDISGIAQHSNLTVETGIPEI